MTSKKLSGVIFISSAFLNVGILIKKKIEAIQISEKTCILYTQCCVVMSYETSIKFR